jgi:hypothetical protein
MRTEQLGFCLKMKDEDGADLLQWFHMTENGLRRRIAREFAPDDVDAYLRSEGWQIVPCKSYLEERSRSSASA